MKHRNTGNMDRIIAFVNDYYRENHVSPSARQIAAGTGIPRTTLQRMMRTMAEEGLIHYDGETVVTDLSGKGSTESVSVGVIGSAPCATLSLEEEAVEEIVQLPVSLFGSGNLFLMRAGGDSMKGAGIDDGDLVLIRKQEEAGNGDIVAAFVEGKGNTLGRYRAYGRTAFLRPENPKYRDIPLKDCTILGVAVSVIRKL